LFGIIVHNMNKERLEKMHIKAARIVSGETRSISLNNYTMRLLAYT